MPGIRTSSIFYRRGVSNNNKTFGFQVYGNYPIIQPASFVKIVKPKQTIKPKPSPIPPTPPTPPDPPTNLSISINDSDYTITAIPPSNTGGKPILSYSFTNITTSTTLTNSSPTVIFTGLSTSQSYTFIAKAINEIGTSIDSTPTTSFFINSMTAGIAPFFSVFDLSGIPSPISDLSEVSFTITPKPTTAGVPLTEPISATYTPAFLQNAGYANFTTNQLQLPIFGLYQDYTNTITTTLIPTTDTGIGSQTFVISYTTDSWSSTDPTNASVYVYPNFTKTVPRNTVQLDYSFWLMKNYPINATINNPIIIDIDGEVRWATNTSFNVAATSTFFGNPYNSVYLTGPPTNNNNTTLYHINLYDASHNSIADLTEYGISNTHHNIDFGKNPNSMLIDAQTSQSVESYIIETDTCGNLIKSFDIRTILQNFIIANGENPLSGGVPFIPNNGTSDWFHLNAACYCPSYNELIMSSRESFVMAIDYDTEEVKWFFGNQTKNWYVNFPNSMAAFAIDVSGSGVYPNGQHAVQIDPNNPNNLLLFDDIAGSQYQVPSGPNALNGSFTAQNTSGVKYYIDRTNKRAVQLYYFDNTLSGQAGAISSLITSSFYQVGTTYLADFAAAGSGSGNAGGTGPIMIGVDSNQNVAFQYKYNGNYSKGWNALPISLSNLVFDLITNTLPSPPTNVIATINGGGYDTSANITWQSPINNGGTPITSYTITSTPGGFTTTVTAPNVSGNIGGLTIGTNYTFKVYATNNVGNSANSTASNSVTPLQPTVPDPPTGLSANGENQSAIINFIPGSDGGSTITNYLAYNGLGVLYSSTYTSPNTYITITGLTNGVTYTVYLKAVNAIGSSVNSQGVTVTPNNNIVTDGLQIYLDAGNPASYPGSGTLWTNLATTGATFNANLYNGPPSYQTANGGYLLFNSSLQEYGLINNLLLTNWTLESWYYYNGTYSGSNFCLLTSGYDNVNGTINYGIGTPNINGITNNQIVSFFFINNSTFYTSPPYTFSSNGWYYITGSFDTLNNLNVYINSTIIGSINTGSISILNTTQIRVMARWDSPSQPGYNGGGLAIARIYNRALTQSEITQNFNFEKARFGL